MQIIYFIYVGFLKMPKSMKKTKPILLLISILFLTSSCGNGNAEEVELLKEQIKTLEAEKEQGEASLDNFASLANELNASLEKITAEQQSIVSDIHEDPELFKTEEMKSKIDSLSVLVSLNKTSLENFKSGLSNTNHGSEVDQMLVTVVQNIEDKSKSIEVLQNQLDAVDVAFDDLFFRFSETLSELDNAKSTLNEKTEDLEKTQKYLNTVWYLVDTYSKLESNSIIAKEGGVMGLGAKRTLKPNFDVSQFTKGDKKTLETIQLPGENIKLEFVTTHPKDSYHIDNNKLIIDNPNDFWSLSKYLVIAYK